jgi:hypothetical protein
LSRRQHAGCENCHIAACNECDGQPPRAHSAIVIVIVIVIIVIIVIIVQGSGI